jgi:hypothetical protein
MHQCIRHSFLEEGVGEIRTQHVCLGQEKQVAELWFLFGLFADRKGVRVAPL